MVTKYIRGYATGFRKKDNFSSFLQSKALSPASYYNIRIHSGAQ